jgi:hypothetical protein
MNTPLPAPMKRTGSRGIRELVRSRNGGLAAPFLDALPGTPWQGQGCDPRPSFALSEIRTGVRRKPAAGPPHRGGLAKRRPGRGFDTARLFLSKNISDRGLFFVLFSPNHSSRMHYSPWRWAATNQIINLGCIYSGGNISKRHPEKVIQQDPLFTSPLSSYYAARG